MVSIILFCFYSEYFYDIMVRYIIVDEMTVWTRNARFKVSTKLAWKLYNNTFIVYTDYRVGIFWHMDKNLRILGCDNRFYDEAYNKCMLTVGQLDDERLLHQLVIVSLFQIWMSNMILRCFVFFVTSPVGIEADSTYSVKHKWTSA